MTNSTETNNMDKNTNNELCTDDSHDESDAAVSANENTGADFDDILFNYVINSYNAILDDSAINNILAHNVWANAVRGFHERGARVLPSPLAQRGKNPGDDYSVQVEYQNPDYSKFLMWFGDMGQPGKKYISFYAWLLYTDGYKSTERSLMCCKWNTSGANVTGDADDLIGELKAAADTDPWNHKRVGWKRMRSIGLADYASDETYNQALKAYDQARKSSVFPDWCPLDISCALLVHKNDASEYIVEDTMGGQECRHY